MESQLLSIFEIYQIYDWYWAHMNLGIFWEKSEHPIAHAIANYAQEKNIAVHNVSDFNWIQGKWLKWVIAGIEYYVGNVRLLKDLWISFDVAQIEAFTLQGKTPSFWLQKKKFSGLSWWQMK